MSWSPEGTPVCYADITVEAESPIRADQIPFNIKVKITDENGRPFPYIWFVLTFSIDGGYPWIEYWGMSDQNGEATITVYHWTAVALATGQTVEVGARNDGHRCMLLSTLKHFSVELEIETKMWHGRYANTDVVFISGNIKGLDLPVAEYLHPNIKIKKDGVPIEMNLITYVLYRFSPTRRYVEPHVGELGRSPVMISFEGVDPGVYEVEVTWEHGAN